MLDLVFHLIAWILQYRKGGRKRGGAKPIVGHVRVTGEIFFLLQNVDNHLEIAVIL